MKYGGRGSPFHCRTQIGRRQQPALGGDASSNGVVPPEEKARARETKENSQRGEHCASGDSPASLTAYRR